MKLKIKKVIFLSRHLDKPYGNSLTNDKFEKSLKKHCNM